MSDRDSISAAASLTFGENPYAPPITKTRLLQPVSMSLPRREAHAVEVYRCPFSSSRISRSPSFIFLRMRLPSLSFTSSGEREAVPDSAGISTLV